MVEYDNMMSTSNKGGISQELCYCAKFNRKSKEMVRLVASKITFYHSE